MEWASEESEERPSFNQLAINKSTIADDSYFKELVGLYGLQVIQEETDYYILDGSSGDLEEFTKDWNCSI